MPFLDDSGIRFEEHRGPIWSAFALIGDQVERFVALNIVWALQALPGILAFAYPEWPGWLRLLGALYSLVALVPATGILFGVAGLASPGEYIGVDTVRGEVARLALPALRSLSPLMGLAGALAWSAYLAVTAGIMVLDVLLVFVGLVLSLVAMYWGPLLADDPRRSAVDILRLSIALAWRRPETTLLQYAVVAATGLIGVVSIGGLVLIVPVAVALLQAQLYRHVAPGVGPGTSHP
jgi:uncharacterized membrane protein